MMKENFYIIIIIIENHSPIANDAYEIMLCVIERERERERKLQSDFNVTSQDD